MVTDIRKGQCFIYQLFHTPSLVSLPPSFNPTAQLETAISLLYSCTAFTMPNIQRNEDYQNKYKVLHSVCVDMLN